MDTVNSNSVDLQTKLIAQDILSKSSSQPIYLTSVEVGGGETFSNDFFKKLLAPLIETQDYTFGRLMKNVDSSYNRLAGTDVFTDIKVNLSSDYASTMSKNVKNYNKDRMIPTKVKFDLKSINLNTGEYYLTSDNDEPLNVKLNYLNNNFNSNAELINLGVDYNPYKPNQHLVTNGKFISNLNNPCFKFVIDVFNTTQNNQLWQQASEKTMGGLIGLQYNSPKKCLRYSTGLSLLKRTLHDITEQASDEVQKYQGDYLKSSIKNRLTYSNLSYLNTITNNFPSSGVDFAIANEISSNQKQYEQQEHQHAPIPSNNFFIKSSISANIFKSFFQNYLTFHLSNNVGLIYNSMGHSNVHVSDKFFLGGSQSFKGFAKNSLNIDGGNQYYQVNGYVYSKLPTFIYLPSTTGKLEDGYGYEPNPLRLYANGIIGNVSSNLLNDKSYCSSVGFGIKYFNNWANFDLGYYLAKRSDDSIAGIKDGLQFSFAICGSNRLQ